MKIIQLVLFIVGITCSNLTFAQFEQDSTSKKSANKKKEQLVLIKLKDGKEFIGYITKQNDQVVVLKTENYGTMTFKWNLISSITNVKKKEINKRGIYEQYNLQSTRYFFGPSGHGLKKGEGYYQNVWISANQISYGITDHISISGGTVPLFLFGGAPTPVWVIPKVSFPIVEDVLSVGAGAVFGTVLGLENTSFGLGFGTITLGNRNHNLSVSGGYGMVNGTWANNPLITISGMTRLAGKTYLITENYFVPNGGGVLSIGARSFAGKVGIDYGLFFPLDVGIFIGLPWLGITVPFGSY